MTRIVLLVALCAATASSAAAQDALRGYVTPELEKAIAAVAGTNPRQRTDAQISELLPDTRPIQFVAMIRAKQAPTAQAFSDLLGQVDAARLNKMLAGPPSGWGTGLVSRVAAPAVLAAAVEYGSILQESSGTVTTLRGNLLGGARLLFGSQQFPDCPQLVESSCSRGARALRAISASVSFEDTRTGEVIAAAGAGSTASLLGEDYRVAAWGVRLDLTRSNNLDDPRYLAEWNLAIDALARDPASAEVTRTVVEFFSEALLADDGVYAGWREQTSALLKAAPGDRVREVLTERLQILVNRLEAEDPEYRERADRLAGAYANYAIVRDRLLKAAQTHKLTLEYTNRRPLEQPFSSNVRLIYSHQPTAAPAVVTLNAAVSVYHQRPAVESSRLRDVQLAGQIDRRLGDVGSLGPAVLTIAGYYQWMKDDALIVMPQGTTVPGSGIDLPDEASRLLGTRGHIGAFQAKVSVALTESVKVPLSMTWATRRELIREQDVRGQVGLTLDIDQLLH